MGIDLQPSRPLSTAGQIVLQQRIPAGTVSGDVVIRTVATGGPAPDKHVAVHVGGYPQELPLDAVLTGTVTAQ